MKIMFVIGNDNHSTKLVRYLEGIDIQKIDILIDKTPSLNRSIKALKKQSISISALIHILWSTLFRKRENIKKHQTIKSNTDLMDAINLNKPNMVILFKCGLIINQKVINSGSKILNIHCANLPEYSGLGSIYRAIQEGKLDQHATLHFVEKNIDSGRTIYKLPYRLSESLSYRRNETLAYEAGHQLIQNLINNPALLERVGNG